MGMDIELQLIKYKFEQLLLNTSLSMNKDLCGRRDTLATLHLVTVNLMPDQLYSTESSL